MGRYFDDFNDEIMHYGVKGMKWRNRRPRSRNRNVSGESKGVKIRQVSNPEESRRIYGTTGMVNYTRKRKNSETHGRLDLKTGRIATPAGYNKNPQNPEASMALKKKKKQKARPLDKFIKRLFV